ncbi:Sphingomyelin phosphodiesterase [Halotydeus destructor]|nr:Sphingomyelin phosphodiesterase [Halotydeus destructor]
MVSVTCLVTTCVLLVSCLPTSAHGRTLDSGLDTSNELPVDSRQVLAKDGDTSFLTKLTAHIFEMLDLRQVIQDIEHSKTTVATCYTCKFGMALIQHLIEFGRGKDELASLANTICVMLKVEKPQVCKGMTNIFKEEFVTVIAKLALTPSEICGIMLGDKCAHTTNPLHNWTLPLSPIPKPDKPRPGPPRKSSGPPLRVLQLSDTHIDTQYSVGGDAVCGEPLCCRPALREAPGHELSGYWGDYRDCDIPLRTLDAMLAHIGAHHGDLDYVMWTGDVPAHDVWNQTRKGQIKLLRTVSALIDKHLGHVAVLPALGNHESAPVNRGAYYATKIRPGLKIISLNMNYCNNQNWWLLLNSTDPADELTWLINELQVSELLAEKVHIIGHIPPGSNDCLQVWSRNYHRIVNRFEATIVAQFFGHTHNDEFELFYDEATLNSTSPRAINVAYVAPSVTTFGGVNPGYRIYSVDRDTFDILDHETYFANLTLANLHSDREPMAFQLAYSAKQAFGLESLRADQWHKLVMDMIYDENLFQQFYTYYFNKSDYVKHKPCNDQVCKGDILCRLLSGKSHDFSLCQKLLKDLDFSLSM